MNESWKYYYAGMNILSDMEIPEWRHFPLRKGGSAPDVRISLEPAGAGAAPNPDALPIVTENEYSFFAPEVGYYHIRDGEEIRVSPLSDAGARELRLFLLGTAWAALCYQRGVLAIHAGAVAVDGSSLLFCGMPGMGKSTITACLADRGYLPLSDDLCCLNCPSSGTPAVFPAGGQFRLWKDTLAALHWDNQGLERDHFRHDKYLTPWEREPLRSPVPLRAVYLLEWGELGLTRLSGLRGLSAFVRAATYRGEMLERMGMAASYWDACLQLVRQVPVLVLSRPKELETLDRVIEFLEQQWRDGG